MVFQRPFYTSIAIKNASGYFSRPRMDLLDLLIGSEGTLAIFLKAGISLQKKPAFLSGLSFFPSRDSVFDFADFLRTEQQVSAMEYFDRTAVAILEQNRSRIPAQFPNVPENKKNAVYWEVIESTPGIFESSFDRWDAALSRCGSSFDETWSGFEPVEADRLKVFRHAVPELINAVVAENKRSCPQVRKISTDSALPSSAFRKVFTDAIRLIEESSIPHAIFGHLGDFHLHMNIMPRNEMELDIALDIYHEIMSVSIQNGGTVSAEHGIGKIKREYLKMMYGSEGILEMKKVKAVLDHESMLNPGNLF